MADPDASVAMDVDTTQLASTAEQAAPEVVMAPATADASAEETPLPIAEEDIATCIKVVTT
ncbi:hypothetical protein PINS_up003998 [Pythium insidiosum]|nr:hypothetical protein PINS_up003998 [Pythium insidiosum]